MSRPAHYARNGALAGIGLYSIVVLIFLALSQAQPSAPASLHAFTQRLPAQPANPGPIGL